MTILDSKAIDEKLNDFRKEVKSGCGQSVSAETSEVQNRFLKWADNFQSRKDSIRLHFKQNKLDRQKEDVLLDEKAKTWCATIIAFVLDTLEQILTASEQTGIKIKLDFPKGSNGKYTWQSYPYIATVSFGEKLHWIIRVNKVGLFKWQIVICQARTLQNLSICYSKKLAEIECDPAFNCIRLSSTSKELEASLKEKHIVIFDSYKEPLEEDLRTIVEYQLIQIEDQSSLDQLPESPPRTNMQYDSKDITTWIADESYTTHPTPESILKDIKSSVLGQRDLIASKYGGKHVVWLLAIAGMSGFEQDKDYVSLSLSYKGGVMIRAEVPKNECAELVNVSPEQKIWLAGTIDMIEYEAIINVKNCVIRLLGRDDSACGNRPT